MRLQYLYIILLLLAIPFSAEAQKKKKAALKKHPAKKEIAKKKVATAKKAEPKTVSKNETGSSADTTIKGTTIEIVQSYKPEVKQTTKPELSPAVPPIDTSHASLTYEVPAQTLSYTYYAQPLKPLALDRDSSLLPFANYVKLGGGNLSTLYGDAAITSLCGKNFESAFHLHHLSQKGSIPDQKISNTGLEADGTLYTRLNSWHANIAALHNIFYYYGYDRAKYSYTSSSLKQTYTGVKFGLDMKDNPDLMRQFNYHPAFNISLYTDNYNASERTIDFNVPVNYTIDSSIQLGLGINASLTQYDSKLANQTNTVIQVTPGLRFNTDNFSGKVGLYPTFGKDNTYLLPDLELKYHISQTLFNVFIGWQGLLKKNTLEELSTRNPYMFTSFKVQQTHTDEVFGGIQGNIGSHVSFSARISWWQYQQLPLFVNDTAGDNKQFKLIVEPRVNALSFQAGLRYQVADVFSVGGMLTLRNFSNQASWYVWHEPTTQLTVDLMFKPVPKLSISAYLSVMDGIYAIEKADRSTKLNTIFDLGANAEYQIIPRLCAFLQVNNLLNNKYQRWMGYEAFGINVYGGIRFKF